MASKLAQAIVAPQANRSKVRDFYHEVCRCLPFIARLHNLEEVTSMREMRAMVKSKFNEFKSAKDPRVIDLLIFKGREELENYMLMHKQHHHAITEYVEPFQKAQVAQKSTSLSSSFLNSFLDTPYPQIPRKD